MGQCYCPYPYTGKKCENYEKVKKRVSTEYTVLTSIFVAVLGWLTVYFLKKTIIAISNFMSLEDDDVMDVEIFVPKKDDK